MKMIALAVVMRVRKLPAPRLPKIVFALPPPRDAPRSWPLPRWSSTTPIRMKQTRK